MAIKLGSSDVSFRLGATEVDKVYLGATQVYPSGTPAALLLNFNGTNGSTTFTDSSANAVTVTANGDAKLSTSVKKYGSASLELDGSSSASVADAAVNQFGAGDFTIEMWVWPQDIETMTLAAKWDTTDLAKQAWFLGSGDEGFYVGGLGKVLPFGSWPATEQWIHVAVTRSGSDLRLFVNGQQSGSTYNIGSTAIPAAADVPLTVGDDTGANPGFEGYIDDFRIVKGKAVYTANFTPPAAELGPNA